MVAVLGVVFHFEAIHFSLHIYSCTGGRVLTVRQCPFRPRPASLAHTDSFQVTLRIYAGQRLVGLQVLGFGRNRHVKRLPLEYLFAGERLHYLGGKTRIAKSITDVMLSATSDRAFYVEPFVGAGSVAVQMVPHFDHAYLSDASPDLIALWKALQDGWKPPEILTEGQYAEQRNAPVSALRGFVGYGCSFGGKWFGGYARHTLSCCGNPDKTYAQHSARSLAKKLPRLLGADFYCLDYQQTLIPNGAVVYLDPPYKGTTGYARTGDFDNAAFWGWAEKTTLHASVFVSEYSAPEGWVSIWDGSPQASLRLGDKTGRAKESLWIYQQPDN